MFYLFISSAGVPTVMKTYTIQRIQAELGYPGIDGESAACVPVQEVFVVHLSLGFLGYCLRHNHILFIYKRERERGGRGVAKEKKWK